MELSRKFIEGRLTKLGKTKTGLAKAMGIGNSAVSAILAGGRLIKARELPAIIEYLELQTVPVMGRIGAGACIEPEFEQVPPEGFRTVDLPFPVSAEMIAFEILGDSMVPRYDEGDIIVVYRDQQGPVESYFGQEVALVTSDGRRFLKVVRRGSGGRGVTLTSFNASEPIENVKVKWVGEVYVRIPASQVRRMRRGIVAAE